MGCAVLQPFPSSATCATTFDADLALFHTLRSGSRFQSMSSTDAVGQGDGCAPGSIHGSERSANVRVRLLRQRRLSPAGSAFHSPFRGLRQTKIA